MPEFIELILIGMVQGISEFLPLSSSGHLSLLNFFLKIKSPSLLLIMVAHLGTLMSIITVYGSSLYQLGQKKLPTRLFLLILMALLPTIVGGFFLKSFVEQSLKSPTYIAWGFILTGICLFLTRLKVKKWEDLSPLDWKKISFLKAFMIGVSQTWALFPGISRSGWTISTALFLNIPPRMAVFFSFLLAIPTLLAGGLWELWGGFQSIDKNAMYENAIYGRKMLLIFLISWGVGWIALKGLISSVRYWFFPWFAFYLWSLGAFVLFI